jgi:hypothetical protein
MTVLFIFALWLAFLQYVQVKTSFMFTPRQQFLTKLSSGFSEPFFIEFHPWSMLEKALR